MKIEVLEALPREMVGDGLSPNVFFVSQGNRGVILIARDFETAYNVWRSLPRDAESCLEDRQYGVICDTSPDEERGGRLITEDGARSFCRDKHIPLPY